MKVGVKKCNTFENSFGSSTVTETHHSRSQAGKIILMSVREKYEIESEFRILYSGTK